MPNVKRYQLLFLVVILSVISLGWTGGGPSPQRSTWEYRVVEFDASQNTATYVQDVAKMLSQQGIEGWELIHDEPGPQGRRSMMFYYFKRSK